eukprot:TRINITY_DN10274_c0_g1_i1.p1 TRINITY_DN10274_c0_g1~~TRINITY_DN10274_c0_g1_i1.p1  ORF type:complete len:478 (+),score=81.14 TRINITY_DN10274_c0_g1_i1:41-1474(+)
MSLGNLPAVPVADGMEARTGSIAVSQVAACRRWVSELQASLALLAEHCGSLEKAHQSTLNSVAEPGQADQKLGCKSLSSTPGAKVQDLDARHSELMTTVRQLVATQQDAAWSVLPSMPPSVPPVAPPPIVTEATEPLTPASSTSGCLSRGTLNGNRSVSVIQMSGREARQDDRLRFHDVQAQSAPDTPSYSSTAPRPSRCFSNDRAASVSRAFPGAVPAPSTPGSQAPPCHGLLQEPIAAGMGKENLLPKQFDQVDHIRHQATELGNLGTGKDTSQTTAFQKDDSPLRLGIKGADGISSSSGISDVWARFHPSRGGDSTPWLSKDGSGVEIAGAATLPTLTHALGMTGSGDLGHASFANGNVGAHAQPNLGSLGSLSSTNQGPCLQNDSWSNSTRSMPGAGSQASQPIGFVPPVLFPGPVPPQPLQPQHQLQNGSHASFTGMASPNPLPPIPGGPAWSSFPTLTIPSLPGNMQMQPG